MVKIMAVYVVLELFLFKMEGHSLSSFKMNCKGDIKFLRTKYIT